MSAFRKAERRQAKLKIAITGPSGSGKTFSALLIAAGIGKRIAVVDTENKSASLYADVGTGPLKGIAFDILEIDPPYTIPRYLEAIELAEKEGYDVLILDSISHAWAGEGGLLDKKGALDQRAGSNSYANWATITPEHERFKARILQSDLHIICTMRSKQDYILEQNEKGKSVPKKVGLAPIQRDGMEYEFTTVLDLAMDHHAIASKDRTSLFDGQVFKPTRDTGKKIMAWLLEGKPILKPEVAAAPATTAAKTPDPAAGGQRPSDASGIEQPGEFPDEEKSESTVIMATPEQLIKIKEGIAALRKLGRQEATIWMGISDHVKKIHGRGFAEPSELTNVEAETVIDYLGRWAEHLREGKAKARDKHAAGLHEGAEA